MAITFIQITDHHLGEHENSLLSGYHPVHALRKVLQHIAEHESEQFDFIVSTGDLVNDPTAQSYRNFVQFLHLEPAEAVPGPALTTVEGLQAVPMYFLPGNHDDREEFYRHLF